MTFTKCSTGQNNKLDGWKYGKNAKICSLTLKDAIRTTYTFDTEEKMEKDLDKLSDSELEYIISKANKIELLILIRADITNDLLQKIYIDKFGVQNG